MEYRLLNQDNPYNAYLEFKGPFKGKEVTWDTHFQTLKEFIRKNQPEEPQRQFIKINDKGNNIMELYVVLNIEEINHPAISKMIIMIRQYKNLSTGIHKYGEAIGLHEIK